MMKYFVFFKQLIRNFIFPLIVFNFICACASSSYENETPRGSAMAHPAAYSQDHFTFNKPQKQREFNQFEFYYKHCNVDERKPFPTGALWECTQP